MAIVFIDQGTVATGANPTVALPTYANGDLLLLICTSSVAPSTPSGWGKKAGATSGNYLTVFYRTATTSESNVSLTVSGTETKAVMLSYRNVNGFDGQSTFGS